MLYLTLFNIAIALHDPALKNPGVISLLVCFSQ